VSGQVAGTKTGRKRAMARAVQEVAHYLGNTPAVCRASYIDPRVFDAYRAGLVIGRPLREAAETEPGELPIHQRALEEAVLDLIDERDRSPALERVAA
jgi:DNA topoisomerase IB